MDFEQELTHVQTDKLDYDADGAFSEQSWFDLKQANQNTITFSTKYKTS